MNNLILIYLLIHLNNLYLTPQIKLYTMKKVLFTVALAISGFASAQSVETIAKQAAIDAGCITNGGYDYQTNVIGACSSDIATTSVMQEVYVLPKVSPKDAPIVRLAPLARVVICGTEVLSVDCMAN